MDLYNLFFGPLDKEYCYLFVIFAAIALFTVIIATLGFISSIFTTKPKEWLKMVIPFILAIIYPGIIYLHNRLLLNMCL